VRPRTHKVLGDKRLTKRNAKTRSGPSASLHGKVALVTGGNAGIGLAIAKALAAEGCALVITGRDAARLNRASREVARLGVRVLSQICEVKDAVAVEGLFQAIRKQFGRLDILVNNAGISHPMANVDQLEIDAWQEVIATNLTGMFLVTRSALPLMKRGAAIVNNLSVAAKDVFAGEAAYCASKHGGLGFTNTLREELRPRGIRVIALMPGATDTGIWKQFWPDAPRKNMLSPETVAAALISALTLPANSTVDELVITPTAGSL
jgi:NAD(P)-dependent dehydrogenase (short-subunit alcohol dehydrogenase family)